jgi:ERCC4-type nuclease
MSFGDEHQPEPVRMTGAQRASVRARPVPARPRVLIDSREQAPLRFSDAVETELVTLPAGDYSLAGYTADVAIERKSLPDFVACCTSDRERFEDQIARLAKYQHAALVIETDWATLSAGAYRSQAHPRSITGSLLALMHDNRLPVLLAGDAAGAAEVVERLLLRVAKIGVVAA